MAVLISSLLCIIVAGAFAWFLSDSLPVPYTTFLVALFLLPLYALITPLTGFLVGLHKVARAHLPSLFVAPITFLMLIGIGLWYRPGDISPTGVLGMQILAAVITAVSAIMLFAREMLPKIRDTVPRYEGRILLKSAFPVALMGSMYIINTNADILMLGSMRGVESAGIYKAATRGAEIIMLVSTMIGVALAPIISALHTEENMARLQRGITKSTRISFILALPICLGLVVFGRWFLMLFGAEFVLAYDALVILSIMQLISVAAGPVRLILVMTGNERIATAGLAASTTLNIILNYLLIPPLGITGAALATAISTLLSHLFLIRFVWKLLGINPTALVRKSRET